MLILGRARPDRFVPTAVVLSETATDATFWVRGAVDLEGFAMKTKYQVSHTVHWDVAAILRWVVIASYLWI